MRSLQKSIIDPKTRWAVELVIYLSNGFGTFHNINMGSVGQRAAKLLSFKVRGLK